MPTESQDAGAVLAPGRGQNALLGIRPLGAEKHGWLVEFVDQTERQQQHAAANRQVIVDQVIEVGELDPDFVGMLDLDLGVEQELVVEAIAGIEDRPQEIQARRRRAARARLVLAVEVLEQHLAVAGERDALRGAAIGLGSGRRNAEAARRSSVNSISGVSPLRSCSTSAASTSMRRRKFVDLRGVGGARLVRRRRGLGASIGRLGRLLGDCGKC